MTDKPQDTEIDSKITAKLDRIDLNNEMAGIDTGKSWRFLSSNSPSHPQVRKKLETEREFRSMLDMLLTQDPHYAALYKKVTEKVEKAQQAVDLALVDINKRLEASDRKFQVLRENAVQLQDGTKVFQSNDGSIYTEQGKRLSYEKARNIKFSDNAPSWENYKAEKENHDIALRQKEEVKNYQHDVLDHATKRMNDKDNPPSKDELEDIKRDISEKKPEVLSSYFYANGASAQPSNSERLSVAQEILELPIINTPSITSYFDKARLGITKEENIPQIKQDQNPALVI